MKSIDGLLNTIKQRHNISSDYKLSLFLGIGQGNIANYRHKRSMPDARACEKIAKALDMDPDLLIVHFEAQRAQTEEVKAVWIRIAQRLQAGAVHAAVMLCLAIVSLAGYAPNAEATALSFDKSASQSVYYVKLITLRFFRTLRRSIRAKFQRFVQGINHVQSADTDAAHPHFA